MQGWQWPTAPDAYARYRAQPGLEVLAADANAGLSEVP